MIARTNPILVPDNNKRLYKITDPTPTVNKNLLPKSNAKNAIQVHRFIQTMKKSDIQENKKIIYHD